MEGIDKKKRGYKDFQDEKLMISENTGTLHFSFPPSKLHRKILYWKVLKYLNIWNCFIFIDVAKIWVHGSITLL